MTGSTAGRRGLAIEWGLRSFAIAVHLAMLVGIVATLQKESGRYSLLLLLAAEGFTLALVAFAKVSRTRDASPIAILAAAFAAAHFGFYDYEHAAHLIPE